VRHGKSGRDFKLNHYHKVSRKEVDAVFALPGPDRYEHFVKRVADWEEVWGLASEGGWVMMGDSDGHQVHALLAPRRLRGCLGSRRVA
jgi:hypothetical protein